MNKNKEHQHWIEIEWPEELPEQPELHPMFATLDITWYACTVLSSLRDFCIDEEDWDTLDAYCWRVYGKPIPRDPNFPISHLLAYLHEPREVS